MSGQRSEQVESMRDMTLKEASNVAWHVRVNGLDGVTAENLKGAFAVLEKLAEREPLVQRLVGLADPPYDDGKLPMLRDCGRAVRDFKLK